MSCCRRRCPASRPAACWSSSPRSAAYLAPDLLGGGKTAYVGNLIQAQFAVARDMPFGAALSFVLSLVVAALLVLFRRPLAKAQAL